MSFLSTNSLTMMERSLGFLWTKQAAILDNIANAETPNYKPKVVTFEESFREQLERASSAAAPRKAVRQVLDTAQIAVVEKLVSTRMDDNGVNITEQSTEMIRNAYQIRYVMSALNSDLAALRIAIQG